MPAFFEKSKLAVQVLIRGSIGRKVSRPGSWSICGWYCGTPVFPSALHGRGLLQKSGDRRTIGRL